MLLTKLHIPSTGQNIVHRSSLFEKLNSGLGRKLILISAPAGYGKTTLVSDWIGRNKIPAAWLSVDGGDNDPALFLNYIITAIQNIQCDFGKKALQLLNSPGSLSIQSIAGLLINDLLNIRKNFLLVLDDFHLINNNEVLNLVSLLLDHAPNNIYFTLLTRSDPALSISRLRSRHQIVELRLSDLGFSANDISDLFNRKLKIKLSPEDAFSLESRTEGWIAGLKLAALSMQNCDDIPGYIRDLKGDNRYIIDYLVEEVLKFMDNETKEFLLQTSLLEQISAPLCNFILNRNDSQLFLEKLERDNMFIIPLDDDRTWYRYHHLFAQLLKQKLQQHGRDSVKAIHDKACEWYLQNSMPLLAIEHSIEAKVTMLA